MNWLRTVAAAVVLLLPLTALAHKQSDSYLSIDTASGGGNISLQWDIALRDLDFVLGLDADANGELTWGEIKSRKASIEEYALRHLRLADESGANCPLNAGDLLIDDHVDGAYAVLRFSVTCATVPRALQVDYSLLFEVDPNHHGLMDVRTAAFNQAMVLTAQTPSVTVDLQQADGWGQLRSFVSEGVWHIWHGYDHILFLLTLLLPAVVVRRQGTWWPRESWRDAALDIVKVVTAFTLAHSLTLSLAALGFIQAPSRLVESAIAITVLLGALNILFPVVYGRRWLVAMGFGLIHGLGFASVLADLGLASGALLRALLGFNLGVEMGQLAIVVLVMPVLFAIRGTRFYRQFMLPVGAVAIALLALYWVASRAFPQFLPAF